MAWSELSHTLASAIRWATIYCSHLTKRNGQDVRGTAATKGQEIVEGLRELSDTLRAGKPLESRFTLRTYKIPAPPQYGGAEVRRAREVMAMSQVAFAALLGVDPSTVRS